MLRVIRPLVLTLALILVAAGIGVPALGQSVPEFKLGFKALADQIPSVAGNPVENEHWGDNGDSLQQTTTGLMVWRKADNWTAFTNGSRTWINGPAGVQDRANDESFDWEAQAPAASPAPAATLPQSASRQARPIPSARTPQLFRPTDILVFSLPDWSKLDVTTRTHATVVGSARQPAQPRLNNFDTEPEVVREVTGIAHRAGLRYVTPITSDSSKPIPFLRSLNAAALNIDGQEILQPMDPPGRLWLSLLNPRVKELVVDLARKAVDSGVDVLAIDTWTLNYDVTTIPRLQGDFSEYSLQGFREYLRKKYDPGQLAALGIQDIGSFDYGQYIRQSYLAQYRDDRASVPLFSDFADFQMESSRQFWRDVVAATRVYAQQTGKKISFAVNIPEHDNVGHYGTIKGLPIVDLVDGFISEYPFPNPPDGRVAPVYKLFQGLGKPVALNHNSGVSWELLSRPDAAELTKLWTAEAYSSGGFVYVPYADLVWGPTDWNFHSADLTGLYPYYDFITSHPQYYEKLLSAAKTAVLYSYASLKADERLSASFFGTSRLLLDAHRQYDVLFAGDGRWIQDKLISDDLNPYDVVILPAARNLSDRQIDLLLGYLERGGTVLAFGETGTRDEADRVKPREQLARLLVPGSQQYGQGQFVYLREDVGAGYLSGRDGASRKQIEDVLDGLTREDVRTSADSNLGMEAYLTPEGYRIVHLINYDYDLNAQRFNRKTGIDMEVSVGTLLQGKDLAVFYSSPDGGGVQELKYSLGDNTLKFQVPALDIYGVVFVGERRAAEIGGAGRSQ